MLLASVLYLLARIFFLLALHFLVLAIWLLLLQIECLQHLPNTLHRFVLFWKADSSVFQVSRVV